MLKYGGLIIYLALLLYGCSIFKPPADYYKESLDMESYGEQTRKNTGRTPGKIIEPPKKDEQTKILTMPAQEPPIKELIPKPLQREELVDRGSDAIKDTSEQPISSFQKETQKSPPFQDLGMERPPEPIAISSVVIKSALEIAGVSVRAVELVNGRLGSGRNSVRINFLCDSETLINDKFFTICAVIYHLNKSTNTIDVVVGIAEDSQSNLKGILQSNIEDITAWMNNLITRAEWFSRITRNML